jgi:hypothetical protein
LRLALIPCLALAALLLIFGRGAIPPAAAGSHTAAGTVSGYVFHDLDRGVRDEGEPGLRRLVQLVQNHNILAEELSASDGSYSMTDVPPGEYELTTALSEATQFCEEPGLPGFFDPLALFGCSPLIEQPWQPTTPERVDITVAGGAVEVDFGGVPFDQSVLIGRAIFEDDYAARDAGGGGRWRYRVWLNNGHPAGWVRVSGIHAGDPRRGRAGRLREGG